MAKKLLILVVPAFYLLGALATSPGPAYRMVQRDPSYYYLLGSFSLASGERSNYYAHPGLPLQALGGIAVAVRAATGRSPEALLGEHEAWLAWLCGLVIAANSVLLATAGWLALRQSRAFTVVAAQATFFVVPSAAEFSGFLQPESCLIGAGSLLWISLLLRRRHRWLQAPVLGSLIALKLNFLPFLAATFRWRAKVVPPILLLGAALTFLAWFPVTLRDSLGAFTYLRQIVFPAHTPGMPAESGGETLAAFFLTREPWLLALLVLLASFSLSALLRKRRRLRKRQLLAALIAVVGVPLLYLRSYGHGYYVLPAAAAAPAAFWLLMQVLRGTHRSTALVAAVACLGAAQIPGRISALGPERISRNMAENNRARIDTLLYARPGCEVQANGPVPHGPAALAMGAGWAAPGWLERIGALHPKLRSDESGLPVPPGGEASCRVLLSTYPHPEGKELAHGEYFRFYSLDSKPASPVKSKDN